MGKILVVDDSQLVREDLESLLLDAGLEVVTAVDGNDGITKAKGNPDISLIITDHNMPGKDGMEMAEVLRQDPTFAKTDIVMLTTEVRTDLKKRGMQLGIRAWLIKPLNAEVVGKVIEKLLKG